jgi:hypothetical protein
VRRFILWVLFPLILLGVVYVLLLTHFADSDLRELQAEADRLDPGWRLEELEAKRAVVPDDQNAALVILAAAKLLPQPWPPVPDPAIQFEPDLVKRLATLSPAEQLDPGLIQTLTAARAQATAALAEARKVSELPTGRYPITYSRDGISTTTPGHPAARQVALLLSLDVLLRAQEQDTDGALTSCRALLNVARSFGDEPVIFTPMVRMELRTAAWEKAERVLAQGEASDATLAALQRLLEKEEAEPLFLYGARAERATWERLFTALEAGEITRNKFWAVLAPKLALGSRSAILQLSTRLVEISKLPMDEQVREIQKAKLFSYDRYPFFARTYLVPKVEKVTHDLRTGQSRGQAELRCAIAAIAAERYRRAHGSWPASLAALVPDPLAKVPTDPYDRQPLRMRRRDNGLVIYSVGPDGQDNGGVIDPTKPSGPGTDVGFQLWDVKQRRQPAKGKPLPAP